MEVSMFPNNEFLLVLVSLFLIIVVLIAFGVDWLVDHLTKRRAPLVVLPEPDPCSVSLPSVLIISTKPTAPAAGELFLDRGRDELYCFDGAAWALVQSEAPLAV